MAPVHVLRARGRRHRRPDVLCQLDCESADTARACLDKHLLPFLQACFLDQRLPGGQSDQRDGGRLRHREVPRLGRNRTFLDRDQLGERTDSIRVRPRIHFVTGFETPHSRSDFEDDASHVVAQDERKAIRQKALELALATSPRPALSGIGLARGSPEMAFTTRGGRRGRPPAAQAASPTTSGEPPSGTWSAPAFPSAWP